MLISSDGGSECSHNELSIDKYKEITHLTNSFEFKQKNLSPAAAEALINLYNKDPLVHLDPRVCSNEIRNLSVDEIMYNFAYLDFWQSVNYKSQYAFEPEHPLVSIKQDIDDYEKTDLVKHESHPNDISIDSEDDTTDVINYPMKCVLCGRKCRYLMYILLSPITNGNLVPFSPNCDLSECIWCSKCYASGRIPPTLLQNHFSKVQIPFEFADKNSPAWTDQQIKRLIDGITTYNDDWDSVGKYVGRSPHECVLKFSQLPIEDLVNKGSSFDTGAEPVVFEKTPNEFLAYLAFIANSFSPVISSSSAKAALEILLSDSSFDQASGEDGNNSTEPMFRYETFKIACDMAQKTTHQNTRLLADMEQNEIQKLLKEIYSLELQIALVQTEKCELLDKKLDEYTKSMEDSLFSKSQLS